MALRAPRLPRPVAEHLPRGERVLAVAPLVGGDWSVVTTTAIGRVATDGVRWRRPWHEVDHGSWDETSPSITIRWVDGGAAHLQFADGTPRAFPEAFRERVQSSVVHVESLELRGGVTVRAVIRRAENGTLLSQVIADGAVGASDGEASAIRALEARARRAVGLPG
jgi:hypothetical protein